MVLGRQGTFAGGIALPDEKHDTKDRDVEAFAMASPDGTALPTVLRVPLWPDGRHGAVSVVSPGQRVQAGERIARATEGGVDIFAPLAGVAGPTRRVRVAHGDRWELVEALELRDLTGPWTLPEFTPTFDWQAGDNDALRDRLTQGQLVLHRRRPEPLATFLERARRKAVRTLIVNGMENQPYVSADHRVLAEHGQHVLTGAAILARAIGARQTHLAADRRRVRAYGKLPAGAEKLGIHLVALGHKYPIGSDTILTKILTRRERPIGGNVMDVGVAVVNAATCLAVFGWGVCGQRSLGRVTTVVDERSRDGRRGNVYVPWGLACADLLPGENVLHGGPMNALPCPEDGVIGPASAALLAIRTPPYQPPSVCIRCGWCNDYCPARLNVAALNDAFELGQIDLAMTLGVEASMECGVCSYVCPARLPLTQRVKQLKRVVESQREAKAKSTLPAEGRP